MEIRHPFEIVSSSTAGVESPSPATTEIRFPDEITDVPTAGVPSPSPATMDNSYPDEIIDGPTAGDQSPSPATMEIHYFAETIHGVPSPSPATVEIHNADEITDGPTAGVQSPSPATIEIHFPDEMIGGPTSPTMEILYPDEMIDGVSSPSPFMMQNEVIDPRCVFGVPVGIEGGDLFCPASGPRERSLQETEDLIDAHVAYYAPLDVKVQLAEVVNQSVPLISSDRVVDVEEQKRTNIIDENHKHC